MNAYEAQKGPSGPPGASGPSGPPAGRITDPEAARPRLDGPAGMAASADAWQLLAVCLVSGESPSGIPLPATLLDAAARWQARQASLVRNAAAAQASAAEEIAALKERLSAVRAALPKIRSVYEELVQISARMEANDFLAGAVTPAYMLRAKADGLYALYVNLVGKIGGQ